MSSCSTCQPSVTKYPQKISDNHYCRYFQPYVEKSECGDCIEYKPNDGWHELCMDNRMYLVRATMTTTDHPANGVEKANPTWEKKTLSQILNALGV